jgi:hypothetical protein
MSAALVKKKRGCLSSTRRIFHVIYTMVTGRWVIEGISITTANPEEITDKLKTEWGTVGECASVLTSCC